MPSSRTVLTALATVAVAGVATTFSHASAPALRAHSIFNGRATSFRVGAVVEVDAPHSSITKVCVQPAPIDRPACSASKVFAPSAAGSTSITGTFPDGSSAELTVAVEKAASKLGGSFAVPGVVTCSPTRLYSNYDRRHHRLVDSRGTAAKDVRVALYNRVGTGRLAWVYGSNANGFAKLTCTTPKPLG